MGEATIHRVKRAGRPGVMVEVQQSRDTSPAGATMDWIPMPPDHMDQELRMELTLRQEFLLRSPLFDAELLYELYRGRLTSHMIVPTLDGPRLALYHVVSLPRLKEGWPGERWAARFLEKAFISELVPLPYVRYALVNLYHLETSWCLEPPKERRRFTSGPPHHRATEIELGLARLELCMDRFERYWEFRCLAERSGFFLRKGRRLAESKDRIERIADLFERAGLRRGRVAPSGFWKSGVSPWGTAK